jgi:hypothetical protein
MEASFPLAAPASIAGRAVVGRAVFEWVLGGQFLAQHEEIPDPDVPDSSAIIGFDPDSQAYTQHYFDSRGVARVYAMTFSEGVWTLLRETPDFTPLDFSPRFTGTFRDDAKTIAGRWESRTDASSWEHDFDLTYTKVSQPATRVPSAGSFLWPAGAWCRRLRG